MQRVSMRRTRAASVPCGSTAPEFDGGIWQNLTQTTENALTTFPRFIRPLFLSFSQTPFCAPTVHACGKLTLDLHDQSSLHNKKPARPSARTKRSKTKLFFSLHLDWTSRARPFSRTKSILFSTATANSTDARVLRPCGGKAPHRTALSGPDRTKPPEKKNMLRTLLN